MDIKELRESIIWIINSIITEHRKYANVNVIIKQLVVSFSESEFDKLEEIKNNGLWFCVLNTLDESTWNIILKLKIKPKTNDVFFNLLQSCNDLGALKFFVNNFNNGKLPVGLPHQNVLSYYPQQKSENYLKYMLGLYELELSKFEKNDVMLMQQIHEGFIVCCRYGRLENCKIYCDKFDIDVNYKDSVNGSTAIMHAAQMDRLEVFNWLRHVKNADLSLVGNMSGKTAE